MFNSLAAYLLGGAAQPTDDYENNLPSMKITSVEVDDWLLVDKDLPSDSEESLDSIAARFTDSEGEQRASPPPALLKQKQNTARKFKKMDKSRSASCSPARTMEESWFLTPPPCFTSQGPGELATGPLENLLIEHPSMSVYQHGRYATLESLELSDDATRDTSPVADERNLAADATNATRQKPRNARGSPSAASQIPREENAKNSKKANKGRQPLKRGALERSNKAREVNTRNARRRRADHAAAQRHSRANNNRKSC